MYHNIFLISMLRKIGNRVVNNWKNLNQVSVESSERVVPEAVFLAVVSFTYRAVVWGSYVSHITVCQSCLL
jgi:hypothetical protein